MQLQDGDELNIIEFGNCDKLNIVEFGNSDGLNIGYNLGTVMS